MSVSEETATQGLLIVFICVAVGGALSIPSWLTASHDGGYRKARQEAIEAGAAEWRIDPKTGEKSYHYLPRETP